MTASEIKYVNKIRTNYEKKDKEMSKLDQLKALNKKVLLPAEIFAYIFGIIGALVLGTGMCLVMPDVIAGKMLIGIIVGVIGMFMIAVNYPIYKNIVNYRKRKYSAKVIALSNELLNGGFDAK